MSGRWDKLHKGGSGFLLRLWGFNANVQLLRCNFCIAWIFFSQVVEEISKVHGVKKVLVAQHDCYKGFLPGKSDACSWWHDLTLCVCRPASGQ